MVHGVGFWFLLLGLGIARPDQGAEFWIPMAFLIVGALLFLWELSMPGFFVAVPATVLVILGVVGIIIPGFFTKGIILPLLVGVLVATPTTMVTLRVYRSFAPPDAPPTTTSAEAMLGRLGTVTVPVDTETTRGKVRVEGVVWSARCEDEDIPAETRVEVVAVRGVHLVVKPVQRVPIPPGVPAPEPAASAGETSR